AALLCFMTAVAVEAQGLPSARPEQVGMSSERLQRITDILKADVDRRQIRSGVFPGARHGKIAYFETVGVRDPATKVPMTKDSIFRIYSMSKPITSVSAMMLWEDGRFNL